MKIVVNRLNSFCQRIGLHSGNEFNMEERFLFFDHCTGVPDLNSLAQLATYLPQNSELAFWPTLLLQISLLLV